MACKTIHNKIIFYLEQELPAVEMLQVKQHLETCRECALFAAELQTTLGIIAGERVGENDPYFYTRLKARMENRAAQSKRIPMVLARIVQPLAFLMVLFIGIYGGIKLGQTPKNSSPRTHNSEQQMVPYFNEMKAEPIEAFLMEEL